LITEKGEETLRTGMADGKEVDAMTILALELHKRYPEIGNIEEVMVNMILDSGSPEDALDELREGEVYLSPKTLH